MRTRRILFAVIVASACALAAGADDAVLRAIVRDAKGQPVADAVISLSSNDSRTTPGPAVEPTVEIVQQGQEYIPYVTVVPVGTTVVFPNKDDIQHHIYSVSKPKRFEKPLYAPGARESVLFDQAGVVTLGCNIHDWMVAYLVVVPTRTFAKTDATGTAELRAQPGTYRVELWHPRMPAAQSRDLKVESGAAAPLEFTVTLKPDRRIRRAPESKAGGY